MTELLHSHTPYPLLLLFTFRRSLRGGVGQAWAWTYIIFSLFQTQKFTRPLGARRVFRPDWGGELEGEKLFHAVWPLTAVLRVPFPVGKTQKENCT